ncbi:uncharacterized protein F4807DRAFT_96622 [Annulohypoxylon truncatum]|uniref:uncharacterized protein n=1 Tax=Annulohypoxylon truncatum TaxID=327061 RepID=UPI00200749EB|nr:uncharacterized protein F4807DRAFT_96622 [Annulohypoxylon truncatum]KAI1209537.1 hypothetical protein F4807DRAFT_96622 [Annulohypoxylon truncatum]
MRINISVLVATLLGAAKATTGYRGYGLIGHGITMYDPTCAFSCHDVISSYQLSCSVLSDQDDMDMGGMSGPMIMTSSDCYANDDNFLHSMAYCISTHCPHVSDTRLEHYWEYFLVGRSPGQPTPKETYSIALLHADPPPKVTVALQALLNTTTLVDEEEYLASYNSLSLCEETDTRQSNFGLAILITGAVIPVACSLLRFVPFPKGLASQFNAYFIEPPLFGRRHRAPLHNLAIMPTRGQTMLIVYFFIINIVFSCVGYPLAMPNSWYPSKHEELMGYVRNRQGVLSFANVPLLVLYSGRNNILLTITNWHYSTFLLLHRWIAIICTIEACIHSAMYLHRCLVRDEYYSESKLPYWIWGIVAVLAFTVMLPASILPLRQKAYNLFLASHFALSFIALIACYFHIYHRFENQWGYETWIYIGFALWAFDRLMRFARLARNGIRSAEITVVDENNIRVDVPGVSAQGHAYLYFPTLSWRVWENHPFSVMGALTAQEPEKTSSVSVSEEKTSLPGSDMEKRDEEPSSPVQDSSVSSQPTTGPSFKTGLTFFIATSGNGIRSILHSKTKLPVLVESSYAASSLDELRTVPNCILIAGGVGITALAPLLRTRGTAVRLFWGSRSQALVEAVRTALGPGVLEPSIIGEISVGRRLDLRTILEREVLEGSETAVVVCGPVGMADEVRAIVCELGQKGRIVKLVDEAFSW